MKDIADIIEAYDSVGCSGPSMVLATLVRTLGPCYRRPGARMLLIEGGHQAGLLSGRNVEKALHARARKIAAASRPELCIFTSQDNTASVGGAAAENHVLLEPLSGRPDELPIRLLRECLEQRRTFALATVFASRGAGAPPPGTRWVLDDQGQLFSPPAPETLDHDIRRDLLSAGEVGGARRMTYAAGAIEVEALIERLAPPPLLTIFGGGLDVCPLVRISKELGWHVWIVDPDPACANKGRFRLADRVIVAGPDRLETSVPIDHQTIAILATHDFDDDLRLLALLLGNRCRYVGLFGPRERSERVLTSLQRKHPELARSANGLPYAPAGLDIGAETPQEEALAILAQIRARLSES